MICILIGLVVVIGFVLIVYVQMIYLLMLQNCGVDVIFQNVFGSVVIVGQVVIEVLYLLGFVEKVMGILVWFIDVLL